MVEIPIISGLLKKRQETQISDIGRAGIQFEKTIRLAIRQEYIGIMNQTLRDAELEIGYRVDFGDSCFDVIAAPFLEAMDSDFGQVIITEWGKIYEGWLWYYSKKRTYPRDIVRAMVQEPMIEKGEIIMKKFPRMLDQETFEALKNRELAVQIGDVIHKRGMGSAGVRPAKSMEEIDEELRYFGETEIVPDLKYAIRCSWGAKHIGIEAPIILEQKQGGSPYNNTMVPTSSLVPPSGGSQRPSNAPVPPVTTNP